MSSDSKWLPIHASLHQRDCHVTMIYIKDYENRISLLDSQVLLQLLDTRPLRCLCSSYRENAFYQQILMSYLNLSNIANNSLPFLFGILEKEAHFTICPTYLSQWVFELEFESSPFDVKVHVHFPMMFLCKVILLKLKIEDRESTCFFVKENMFISLKNLCN